MCGKHTNNKELLLRAPCCKHQIKKFRKASFRRRQKPDKVNRRDLQLLYIYFISIVILLNRRKATEPLIRRVRNYPNLLPEIPRYCCPLIIEENDTLLCKTTKTYSISTNITMVFFRLQPHYANFQHPEPFPVKID